MWITWSPHRPFPSPQHTGSGPHQNPGAVLRCAPSSTALLRSWSAGGHWGTWGMQGHLVILVSNALPPFSLYLA